MVLARGSRPPRGLLAFVHLVDLVFHEAGQVIFGVFGASSAFSAARSTRSLIRSSGAGYFVWLGSPPRPP